MHALCLTPRAVQLAFQEALDPLAAISLTVTLELVAVCSDEQDHSTGNSGLKDVKPLLESILPRTPVLGVREHVHNQNEESARGEEHLGDGQGGEANQQRMFSSGITKCVGTRSKMN